MAIYQRVEGHESRLRSLTKPPIIVNDLDMSTKDAQTNLNQLLMTRYEGNSLMLAPQCACGRLQGERRRGRICPSCGGEVMPVTERAFEFLLWIRPPNGVAKFINPIVYLILKRATTINRGEFNAFEWLVNPRYRPKKDVRAVDGLIELGFKRGMNFFYENFDMIIEKLMTTRANPSKDGFYFKGLPAERRGIMQFLTAYRDKIFVDMLPIPSRNCFVTELFDGIVSADVDFLPCIDAARSLAGTGDMDLSEYQASALAAHANEQLSSFYENFFSNSLHKKGGLYRHQVFGVRSQMSGRAVITSLTGEHDYREIHIPWSMGVTLLHYHLVNKLRKRGMSSNECKKFLRQHVHRYSPILDELFKELIAESPFLGIPAILHRNPTMDLLSLQLKMITQVHSDPKRYDIALSDLTLVYFNADFDGDKLNLWLPPDVKRAKWLEPFSVHRGVMDVGEPNEMSGGINLHAPKIMTLNNFLSGHYRKPVEFKLRADAFT